MIDSILAKSSLIALLAASVGTPALAVQLVNSPEVSGNFTVSEKNSVYESVSITGEVPVQLAQSRPPKRVCNRAIKILTQYERLAQKFGKRIGARKLRELDSKRAAGTITIVDIPATLRQDYPFGNNVTLNDIRNGCF